VRSLYMLARVLLKQEQTDEGRFWLHKALNAAEENLLNSAKADSSASSLRSIKTCCKMRSFWVYTGSLFETALDQKEHLQSAYSVRSLYMLARVLLKQEQTAIKTCCKMRSFWVYTGSFFSSAAFSALCSQNRPSVFAMKDRKSLRRRGSSLKRLSIKRSICNQHIRCGFWVYTGSFFSSAAFSALCSQNRPSSVCSCFNNTELRRKELWSDVSDLSYQAAVHFKKQENYKLAAKY
jgi:hypothetical protein